MIVCVCLLFSSLIGVKLVSESTLADLLSTSTQKESGVAEAAVIVSARMSERRQSINAFILNNNKQEL